MSLGRALGAALAALIVGGLICSGLAQAATTSFGYTGGEQTFAVPSWVSLVDGALVGGKGGLGASDSNQGFSSVGGFGGRVVVFDLVLTPGQPIYAEVGGNGFSAPSNDGTAG